MKKSMKKLSVIFFDIACAPVFFEHGPMSPNKKGACCSIHAHLHSVAIEVNIKNDFEKRGLNKKRISDFLEIQNQVSTGCPYLFYQNQNKEMYIADAPNIESQLIRKMLAVKIGAFSRLEWMNDKKTDWMIEVIKKIKPYF